MEDVGYPLGNTPNARLEGECVVYTITTNRPHSPEALEAEIRLESRGCRIKKDHETMESFSIITITAPINIVPEAEILTIKAEIERRAAATRATAAALSLYQRIMEASEGC